MSEPLDLLTATHIAMARSRLRYSQIQLANKSCLSQIMVSKIERGEIQLDALKGRNPHQYSNLLRALELDKIRIQVVEIEQPLELSSVLSQEP